MKIACPKQYDDAWYAARRGVPTASNFDQIVTPAKGELSKSADKYICELIGDLADPLYPRVDDYASAAMKNGLEMEPEARAWYALDTGFEVQQTGLMLTDSGRFGASPDGLVGDDGGLELKSPLPKTHVEYLLGGVLPNAYKCQVHGCLLVSGRKWWDFVSYCRGLEPFRIRVAPDEFTLKLKDALDQFWARYQELKAKIIIGPPPPQVMHDPPTSTTTEEQEQAAMMGGVQCGPVPLGPLE